MHPLSNSDRSNGGSHLQGEGWNTEPTHGPKFFKEQIKKANSVPIISVLRVYGIHTNQYTKSIVCPFSKRHRDGQDKSPSFTIYPNTNSFWCFGCKTGNTPIDFVMNMDGISFPKAIEKIFKILSGDINNENIEYVLIDFNQRLDILLQFSSFIRNKITYANDNDRQFIEEVCATFDSFNQKYKKNMTNEALLSIVDRLKQKINEKLI